MPTNLSSFFFAAATILSLEASAQTTVTLTVDMSNEMVSADGVHVAGSFQGWDPAATPMTDNGDGTWSHTFMSDTAATYQYKFINGNAWGSDEGISGACAFDGNRQIEVDGMMGEASSTVCYNSCAACGTTTVLFRVDMSNEDVSPFGVHIAGDFQSWDAGATPLTDADGDMVYEYVHTFEPEVDSVEYKFINGNAWTDVSEFLDGDCANVSGNRVLQFGNDANIVLSANGVGDAYCFNTCSSCILPVQVTFTVDMSLVSSVSEQGVHIAGTFQGWDAESTMLTDNGDGTWSTTLEVAPGAHQFKFINGAGWNGGEENMNGTSCNEGGNRGAVFDANNSTYSACFNLCPGDACLPDPAPANITFQVDASEVDMMGQSMFVFGAFTGWQGGAIEMTDNGDGTWQTTQLVSGSVNVDYKYSIGVPSDQGNDESGTYILAGDSITFEMAGCGVSNGFGGYNRRFVRSGMDEVIPLHCFNQCGVCTADMLYFENFDSYNNGDAITQVSQAFDLWPAAGATDAFVSNDVSWSGANSLKIEGQLTGGPMDVVLTAGLEGIYEFTFRLLVPFGASGYYNFQENIVAGVAWAFECNLNSDGTIRYAVDPATDGSGGPEFTTTYNYGSWIEIKHEFDTDANLMNTSIDGVCVGELPYDGLQIGGLNFYAQGDGLTLPLYYVDDISVTTLEALPDCSSSTAGCTDPMACNYESGASEDDGSCDYSCLGCTNPSAFNYNPSATVDDGSCIFFAATCDFIGNPAWADFAPGLYLGQSQVEHELGVYVNGEFVLHVPGTYQDGDGGSFNVLSWDNLTWSGLPEGIVLGAEPADAEASTQSCLTYSGTPFEEGVFEVTVTGDLMVSVFGNPVSAGQVTSSFTMVITPNENGILGCTYANASNYLPVATIDDGSCIYAGCMDPEASNFQIFATTNDGSCSYECAAVEGPCMFDANNDGSIGSADLLDFLTAFGVSCE